MMENVGKSFGSGTKLGREGVCILTYTKGVIKIKLSVYKIEILFSYFINKHPLFFNTHWHTHTQANYPQLLTSTALYAEWTQKQKYIFVCLTPLNAVRENNTIKYF